MASATAPRAIGPSRRLDGVSYDVRGSAAERASALEAAGLPVLRSNVGDPAAFGFDAGLRAGWLVLSGLRDRARGYIDGLRLVASLRLCPNVAGQLAVPVALALGGLLDDPASRARLQEQRDRAWTLMSSLPGVSCVRPKGAFYAFPRIVPRAAPVRDDRRFALELLLEEHLLVVPGTAFGWPQADHFRIVTLPRTGELEDAAARLERFLRRSAP